MMECNVSPSYGEEDKIFGVGHVEYKDRCGNLDVEASGVVKSEKHFPLFYINGGKYVFKPLSKTKPFTTGMFSIAEACWSNIINHYFMGETPVYRLAVCGGYSDEVPKYYDYGCLVPYILDGDEYMVNVYEFFSRFPDPGVDIANYVNYCMMEYDWTGVLSSGFLKGHKELRETLAMHVLLSCLKMDQNYHYENAAFIGKGDAGTPESVIRVAPMLDHEFSTIFMFPDNADLMEIYAKKYESGIAEHKGASWGNIRYICREMPHVARKFIEGLDRLMASESFINDHRSPHYYDIIESGFLYSCSSDSYMVGRLRYKDCNEAAALRMERQINLTDIQCNAESLWVNAVRWIKRMSYAMKSAIGFLIKP